MKFNGSVVSRAGRQGKGDALSRGGVFNLAWGTHISFHYSPSSLGYKDFVAKEAKSIWPKLPEKKIMAKPGCEFVVSRFLRKCIYKVSKISLTVHQNSSEFISG